VFRHHLFNKDHKGITAAGGGASIHRLRNGKRLSSLSWAFNSEADKNRKERMSRPGLNRHFIIKQISKEEVSEKAKSLQHAT
jgi:hypothetical protein